MRRASLLIALLWASSSVQAAAVEERFTVIAGGNPVGHLVATTDGDRVAIDYDFKNNGRGPTMTEQLRLGADGLPVEWSITGATTFGSKVDEHYLRENGKARWRDSVGEANAELDDTAVYIGQNASPWALGMYARALLGVEGGRLPALPGGQIKVEAGEAVEVGEGAARQRVRFHAISGISQNPAYFLLDERGALFGLASPRFAVIRKGYEDFAAALGERSEALSRSRLETISQRAARRFDAPVRVRNVRVFEPQKLALSALVDVVVYGRQIVSVQPAGTPPTPGEVQVDGEGGTLVPGLYEMHGHIGQEGAVLNLAAGITSVRDMGNNNAALERLVDSIEAGTVAGPRITPSGFIEGRSPFNSNNGILVSSQDEALDAVRWYAARGYPQVKLYNSMNPAWTKAAVAEAHRLGLRAAGHVPAFSNADAMIEAGYDELTHINQVMLGWLLGPEEDPRTLLRLTALKRLATLDPQSPGVRRTLDAIVAKKVAVEPTIAIHENALLNRDGEVPRGAAGYIEHLPIGNQRDAKSAWFDLSAPGDPEAYTVAYERILSILREMHARGVLLIPGTDLGGSFAYHRELQLFEAIGMTPAEVLRRATLDMAAYLGQDQRLGSIEKGKLADFFLVPGDPTADLRETMKIRMVVKDGVVYFPADIHPHFGIKPFAEPPKLQMPEAAAVAQ